MNKLNPKNKRKCDMCGIDRRKRKVVKIKGRYLCSKCKGIK